MGWSVGEFLNASIVQLLWIWCFVFPIQGGWIFSNQCAVVWLVWMLVVGIISFFSQLTLCVIFGACEQNGTLGHYNRMNYFLMHSEPVWCNDSWFIWSCTFKHFHGLLFTMPAHSISANPLLTYTHTHSFLKDYFLVRGVIFLYIIAWILQARNFQLVLHATLYSKVEYSSKLSL